MIHTLRKQNNREFAAVTNRVVALRFRQSHCALLRVALPPIKTTYIILRFYKPCIYCSTPLTANKNLEVKTCIAEEGECSDHTGNSALPLLDTRAGAEFQNPSHSSGHNNCIF